MVPEARRRKGSPRVNGGHPAAANGSCRSFFSTQARDSGLTAALPSATARNENNCVVARFVGQANLTVANNSAFCALSYDCGEKEQSRDSFGTDFWE